MKRRQKEDKKRDKKEMKKKKGCDEMIKRNKIGMLFLRCGFLWMVLLVLAGPLTAQRVDTVAIFSPSMKREIKNVVILPASYELDKKQEYPVVYLLHGYGNRYDGWLKRTKPTLPVCASALDFIIVCPDGESSWYWDSPENPEIRFETYVSDELIEYIDSHYKTIAKREGRAITGFSMGGHGALWLAFCHADVFGACGSMSGGVDIRPFPDSWEMSRQLGKLSDHPKVWDEHTVVNQLYRIKPGQLAIIIDCGTEDFFYKVNQNLHEKLLAEKIPHDYISRPGAHTHSYWNSAVDYQFLFFDKYFDK